MTTGPAYVQGRHWLFAFAVVVVPFAAAVWAAHQR